MTQSPPKVAGAGTPIPLQATQGTTMSGADDSQAGQPRGRALRPRSAAPKPVASQHRAKQTVASCPRCETRDLVRSRAGLAAVLHCRRCSGTFVPRESAAALRESFPDPGPLQRESLAALRSIAAKSNLAGGVRYLACPACAERMLRVQFAPGSGIVVDRCMNHGVWFDRGELDLAVFYFKSGGPADAAIRKKILQSARDAAGTNRHSHARPVELPAEQASTLAKLLMWLF